MSVPLKMKCCAAKIFPRYSVELAFADNVGKTNGIRPFKHIQRQRKEYDGHRINSFRRFLRLGESLLRIYDILKRLSTAPRRHDESLSYCDEAFGCCVGQMTNRSCAEAIDDPLSACRCMHTNSVSSAGTIKQNSHS